MRRTDREFKAEVLRRSREYRARRRQRRKKLLTTALCVVLCITSLFVAVPMLMPMGGSSAETADMAVAQSMENKNSMVEMGGIEEEAAAEASAEAPAEGTSAQYTGAAETGTELPDLNLIRVELSAEDETVIAEYLSGEWVNDLTNCRANYAFTIDGREYRYHSDCGTFDDVESVRSLTVSEEDRLVINEILQAY